MSGISNDPEFIKAENEYQADRAEHYQQEELVYDTQEWTDRSMVNGVFNYDREKIDQRHEVYEQLSKSLDLNERDVRKLEGLGLDKETALTMGYRSAPTPGEAPEVMDKLKELDLRGVPGFYQKEGEDWRLDLGEWKDSHGEIQSSYQGLLVPVRDLVGRIEGFQISLAEVTPGEAGKVWLSSWGMENGASISVEDEYTMDPLSYSAPTHYRNIDEAGKTGVVLVTEGALKADMASELLGGKGVVGVAHMGGVADTFGLGLKNKIPEVQLAVIAVDSDYRNSADGKQALRMIGELLDEAGVKSQVLVWNERQGNSLEEYLSQSKENREMVGDLLKGTEKSMSHSQAETRTQEFGMHL